MQLAISKLTLERIERIAKISRRDPSEVIDAAFALWEGAIYSLARRAETRRLNPRGSAALADGSSLVHCRSLRLLACFASSNTAPPRGDFAPALLFEFKGLSRVEMKRKHQPGPRAFRAGLTTRETDIPQSCPNLRHKKER